MNLLVARWEVQGEEIVKEFGIDKYQAITKPSDVK